VTGDPESSGVQRSLAVRLRALMDVRGIRQRELARRTNLSESSVSRLLSGEQVNPTAHTLQALANALDVSVRSLLIDEETAGTDAALGSEDLLLALYRLIPPEDQARVIGYTEAIARGYGLTGREGGPTEHHRQPD
jgi:transcriptional regulator with XRE-family HTH domain